MTFDEMHITLQMRQSITHNELISPNGKRQSSQDEPMRTLTCPALTGVVMVVSAQDKQHWPLAKCPRVTSESQMRLSFLCHFIILLANGFATWHSVKTNS